MQNFRFKLIGSDNAVISTHKTLEAALKNKDFMARTYPKQADYFNHASVRDDGETKTEEREPRFPIGTKFKGHGKNGKIYTVVDILRTYNNAGELVAVRYVATHQMLGQTVYNRDIVETTIARRIAEAGAVE